VVDHLTALIILCAYGCFRHIVSHSPRERARNLPKDRSPHHHVIYAQTERSKWCQSAPQVTPRTGSAASRKTALASDVLFLLLRQAEEYFGGMYGKDNRILYSTKFLQGFKVVAAKRTWQAAGVPNDGTKVRMTWRAEIPLRRRIVRAEGAAKSASLRHR